MLPFKYRCLFFRNSTEGLANNSLQPTRACGQIVQALLALSAHLG